MRRGARTAQSLQRVALIALFALASYAFLPYLHALTSACGPDDSSCSSNERAPSHSPDCPVCGVIAHAGARSADAPSALGTVTAPVAHCAAAPELVALAPKVELDAACARAPPVARRSA
jgi:hypothetical protein